MSISAFKSKHAFALALLVSALLILRQYTDYLINDYDYEFSWFVVSARITINYLLWAAFFGIFVKLGQYFQQQATTVTSILYQLGASMLIAGIHRLLSVRILMPLPLV